MRILSLVATLVVGVFAVSPTLASAAGLVSCNGLNCNYCEVIETLRNVIRFVMVIAAIIGAIVIMYGGFKMVTAGGDTAGYAEGKKYLLNAVLGLIVLLAAATLVDVLIQTLVRTDQDRTQGIRTITAIWNPTQCGGMTNTEISNPDVIDRDEDQLPDTSDEETFEGVRAGDSFNQEDFSETEWARLATACRTAGLEYRQQTTPTGVVGGCFDPDSTTPREPDASLNCINNNICLCSFGSNGAADCLNLCRNRPGFIDSRIQQNVVSCEYRVVEDEECASSPAVCAPMFPPQYDSNDICRSEQQGVNTCYYLFRDATGGTSDPVQDDPTNPSDPVSPQLRVTTTECDAFNCTPQINACTERGGMAEILGTIGFGRSVQCTLTGVSGPQ